jgi:hypothetical protein
MVRFTAEKEADEITFPFKVDVPMRSSGFTAVLSDMIRWCNSQPIPWGLHSHAARKRDFARFYFNDRQVAMRFAQRWGTLRA